MVISSYTKYFQASRGSCSGNFIEPHNTMLPINIPSQVNMRGNKFYGKLTFDYYVPQLLFPFLLELMDMAKWLMS